MITADQLVLHAVGDYLLQSDWMATRKTKRWWPAAAHALTYGAPFLLLSPSWLALAVIVGTHAVIDRYRLARWVVWARNELLCPPAHEPRVKPGTPFPPETPEWLAGWLIIIADNVIHVLINGAALRWL